MTDWARKIAEGDARALARAATGIENRDPRALEVLRELQARSGHAVVVGITGPPGAGKSTLVDALARELRRQGRTAGIVAVDPTSRRTGGAILGDRIRMLDHHADAGIFIRSMATRGTSGGLAQATGDMAALLDAAGKDFVIIETVGVGQDEVEIAGLAQITVVVLVPGMGDDIQAIKAGIMEIADVFAINKSDQPGADRVEREIQGMLSLGQGGQGGHEPRIIRTVATEGTGVRELLEAVEAAKGQAARPAPRGGHNMNVQIGIIGGSGLYHMPGFEAEEEVVLETPFGAPSDNLVVGKLAGRSVAFLSRHGRGHRLSPSELNYRANIYAMKSLGVERIISLSAVGSLKEQHKPLDFVIPDQFVDRTRGRISTFFGDGLVAHIGFADPICPQLAEVVGEACAAAGVPAAKGGSYLCMEGPAFSTRAESNLYRSWGMDVIGMTNLQEAKLAREAEICYVTVAMVTDYDCWHPGHDAVTVTDIIANLVKNAENACKVVAAAVERMPAGRSCKCGSALAHAIITDRKLVPEATRRKLDLIVGKYFL
ncbi:MAG TPA: S-methyl-5'-thioadenosine phosphorylase [Bryobacteraceae bacterium]|jgi:5'-methylthioadenosine phosphorylase|nr:S-methyl-5'-thioadenosine phosphorylase [Bryobacteraceae bacterium]